MQQDKERALARVKAVAKRYKAAEEIRKELEAAILAALAAGATYREAGESSGYSREWIRQKGKKLYDPQSGSATPEVSTANPGNS